MQIAADQQRFCGREFTAQEVSLIQEVVETCAGISRLELAHTVCELLLSRYHYLGYAMPYGARLQYLVYVSRPRREVVGCVQFSSPAWRMKVRDQWIGWDDATRKLRLQHIVNNSRLLVVARIRNLASRMLSRTLRRLPSDWERQCFEHIVDFLDSGEACSMTHSNLERELETRGRELMRILLQEHYKSCAFPFSTT